MKDYITQFQTAAVWKIAIVLTSFPQWLLPLDEEPFIT